MRRTDSLYLLAVLAVAATFAVRALLLATSTAPPAGTVAAPAPGSAGTAREVDPELIRRLIRRGELSDHEALHASPRER